MIKIGYSIARSARISMELSDAGLARGTLEGGACAARGLRRRTAGGSSCGKFCNGFWHGRPGLEAV